MRISDWSSDVCSSDLRAGEFAAWLGWGRWFVAYLENGNVEVIVRHSPFAYGIGCCDRPACGPIAGVLRAVHLVALAAEATVQEIECAAKGNSTCRFTVEHHASDTFLAVLRPPAPHPPSQPRCAHTPLV